MQISQRNQRYLAGHVTEAEILNTPKNYMKNNLLNSHQISKECDNISFVELQRKQTVFNKKLDLDSTSSMSARKQNDFKTQTQHYKTAFLHIFSKI